MEDNYDDKNWWIAMNQKLAEENKELAKLNEELSKIIEQYKKDQSK